MRVAVGGAGAGPVWSGLQGEVGQVVDDALVGRVDVREGGVQQGAPCGREEPALAGCPADDADRALNVVLAAAVVLREGLRCGGQAPVGGAPTGRVLEGLAVEAGPVGAAVFVVGEDRGRGVVGGQGVDVLRGGGVLALERGWARAGVVAGGVVAS